MNFTFWEGKKVLVTGHTGFKGSWISYWLNLLGADVKGIALEPTGHPNMFDILSLGDKVESCFCDICDLESLEREVKIFDPEIIVHMAAHAIVRESYDKPLDTFRTNVMGTANVFEAARTLNNLKVIISVTSDKCYENKEWYWQYRESDPLGGRDPYSASKGCAEIVSASYRRSFFNGKNGNDVGIATVRAGNVIGGGDWSNDRLIPDIMSAFSENRKVIIRNPTAVRPWQFILDLLYGYLLLAEKLYENKVEYSEAWNFGPSSDGQRNVRYILDKLISYWGNGASWELEGGEVQHEANNLMLDSSKVRQRLGWNPKLELDKTLELVSDWYRNYYNGSDMVAFTEKQISEYESLLKENSVS